MANDRAPIDERALVNLVHQHAENCIGSPSNASAYSSMTAVEYGSVDIERARAMDYYHGRPLGNEVEGRSAVVSQDVRDTIEWAMPQLMRMFVASNEIVRFEPEGPEDEVVAQEITDAVNYVLMRQNDGVMVLHDMFKDALMLKNGYVKVYQDTEDVVTFDEFSGVTPDELTYIIGQYKNAGDTAEIAAKREIGQAAAPQMPGAPPNQAPAPVPLLDIRIRRTHERKRFRVECIAPEDMRIDADTGDDIQASAFVAHVVRKTRSDWQALGHDVDELPNDDRIGETIQQLARSSTIDEMVEHDAGVDTSMEIVEGLEAYMRVDWDHDGYAELRKILVVQDKLIANDPLDEIPIAYCVPVRMPHRHLGISYYDLVKDLQDIKTTLIRQALDNTYLVNNGRPAYNQDTVNAQDLMLGRPGAGIRTKGPPVGQIEWQNPPPIAAGLLQMAEYADAMKANRTGISDTTQGVDPDVLQNSTATAFQLSMNAATAKVELIARMLAEGVKQIALLLEGQLIKHQDAPMILKINAQWQRIDPTQWRRHYDCSVNVGLGTDSQQARQNNLKLLAMLQQSAAVAGIVSPANAYATAIEGAKALGFKNPERFFTDPASPQFQQMHQQQAPVDPKIQVEQMKAQSAQQIQQLRMQESQQKSASDLQKEQLHAQTAQAIAFGRG